MPKIWKLSDFGFWGPLRLISYRFGFKQGQNKIIL